MIVRDIFFEHVRSKPFGGSLTQSQVDGMNAILDAYEIEYALWDLRWLSYALATTAHETGFEMQPIFEYGKGEGMEYGEPDPVTGQAYYGRGFVQLTWDTNYKRADEELGLKGSDSCYQNADNQLRPEIAAPTMFRGMEEGWFRSDAQGKQTLNRYFNDITDNAYGAREIINGDKHIVPSWSHGASIGDLITNYHEDFLAALTAAYREEEVLPPLPPVPVDWPTVVAELRDAGMALMRAADAIEQGLAGV